MDTSLERTYRDAHAFFDDLLTTGYIGFQYALGEGGTYYCLGRARIAMIEFPPPLTILSPFVRDFRIDTPWAREEL